MDWMIKYFTDDPLRFLYLFGGAGGIVYWYDRFTNRIRLRVRLLSEEYDIKENPYLKVVSKFEVENIGMEKTSLIATVGFKGYSYEYGDNSEPLNVPEDERTLEPFQPKTITLTTKTEANYPFLFYRAFKFRLNRGLAKTIRIRKEDKAELNIFQYFLELAVFLLRRRYGKKA
jgi:hypothetical protein